MGGLAELKDIKHHEVTITFADAVPAAEFQALDGVEKVEGLPDGHTLRVTVQGGVDAVIKAAARHSVATLTTHEPSLDDIFLRYYQGDSQAPKEAAGVL